MTRPTLHLPEQAPVPEGIIITCDGPGRPIDVKYWRSGRLKVMHVISIPARLAVQHGREMLDAALYSGITERKEE